MQKRRNILFTIGIDHYESRVWKDLENAVLDCKEIINILTANYSFEEFPDSLFNYSATKQEIYNNLTTLKNYSEPTDNVIIFFAGHGQMNPHNNRGFWIPHDGTADPSSWIENSVIKDFLEDLDVQHVWLIADSCFSGTFLTNTRNITQELTYDVLDQKRSRWMLSSGSEEKVSDGVPKEHSPFCGYLIKFLKTNNNQYTCISEVNVYVKTLTKNNSKQTPRGAFIDNIGHQEGEMVLTLNDELVRSKLKFTRGTPNTAKLRLELAENQRGEKRFSVGKEIVLIESFVEKADYLILENFRFDDDGNKKLKFRENKVIFRSKNEEVSYNLIQRFATWNGFKRYATANSEFFKENKIAVISAHPDIEKVEEQLHCIFYADYLQELVEFNKDFMCCLHCGEKISDNNSYLVEIDELDFKSNAGNVHSYCLRNGDRIIGKSGYKEQGETKLINFDHTLWLELLKKGQGQLQAIKNKMGDLKVAVISWNPENNINSGKYCIRTIYENGERGFMKLGKEIHRFKTSEIDNEIAQFKEQLEKLKKENDCPGMITETKVFGTFQYLSKLKKKNQTITNVSDYEKVLYSNQFEENTGNTENDYTPLGLLLSQETEEIFTIGPYVPLISNPVELENFFNNWKELIGEFQIPKIQILKSDHELDTYIQSFLGKKLQPVINPLFQLSKKELKSGMLIKNMRTIIAESKKYIKK